MANTTYDRKRRGATILWKNFYRIDGLHKWSFAYEHPHKEASIDKRIKSHKMNKLAFLDMKLSREVMLIFAVFFILLAGLEIFCYDSIKGASILASRLWIIYMALFFILCARAIVRSVVNILQSSSFVDLIVLIGVVIAFFYGIGNESSRYINSDGARQVLTGLESLKTPDIGYVSMSEFGYLARSCILPSLPTYWWGKSLFNLDLGFDVMIAVGFLTMYSGTRMFLVKYMPKLVPYNGIISLISLSCPLIPLFAHNVGQAITAPAFSMLTVGWFLMFCCGISIASTLGLGFCGYYTACMYSPGYAIAAFIVLGLAYLSLVGFMDKKRRKHNPVNDYDSETILRICMSTYICVVGLYSLKMVNERAVLSIPTISPDFILLSLKSILFENPYGLFRLFTPVVLIVALLSIAGAFSAKDAFVSLWALITIFISIILCGQGEDPTAALQYAIVTVPVLATLTGIRFFGTSNNIMQNSRERLVINIGFSLYTIIVFVVNLWQPVIPADINEYYGHLMTRVVFDVSEQMDNKIFNNSTPALVFFFEEDEGVEPADYTKYFLPELEVYVSHNGKVSYPSANGAVIYAERYAKLPASIESHPDIEEITWTIDGANVKIKRLLLEPD